MLSRQDRGHSLTGKNVFHLRPVFRSVRQVFQRLGQFNLVCYGAEARFDSPLGVQEVNDERQIYASKIRGRIDCI